MRYTDVLAHLKQRQPSLLLQLSHYAGLLTPTILGGMSTLHALSDRVSTVENEAEAFRTVLFHVKHTNLEHFSHNVRMHDN